MKMVTLVVVDDPELLPRGVVGSQAVEVTITFQAGGSDSRYTRHWHLGQITAEVYDVLPRVNLSLRG